MTFIGLIGGSGVLQAETLNVQANDQDGKVITSIPVTTESVIRFSDNGVNFFESDNLFATVPFAGLESLTFVYGTTAVETIEALSPLRLKENPVGESLVFSGFDGNPTSLLVFDLGGSMKVKLSPLGFLITKI